VLSAFQIYSKVMLKDGAWNTESTNPLHYEMDRTGPMGQVIVLIPNKHTNNEPVARASN